MHFDAEFYVALGFVLFVGVLGYLGVHRQLTSALDARGGRVSAELAEAKRLRDEAAAILASFQKKRAEAEAEAAAIIAQAEHEAARLAGETQARMAEFIERRTKQAQAKIANAEIQATADVRAAAADAAVKAAASVLAVEARGEAGASMVAQGIGDLGRLLRG